ncbi:biopolymer transporter ExbD [Opitutus sp. GAS368]|jgi:biopolymer transport protein ExbD|uniref:ExbD/TolR family protein n=1 Tax=Opitutus sp. GAS368 TaxID=1882749 RepID=UPI00087BF4F1|nr:biopolymer transporter ExbD [Opitutus sp. GAS368]SDR78448.1 Biopolymer transport protein ExbD [Opitutus sp. GAS368]
MITRPLDLESRMSPPPRDLNFVAWVNVGMIVLFFSLLGSRFVLAPGIVIGVGTDGAAVPVQPAVGAGATYVVVSYQRDNVVMFEDGIYSMTELRKQMEAYIKKHPGAVMQVNADRQVSWQSILDLCTMAKAVGFAYIVVPTESPIPAAAPR